MTKTRRKWFRRDLRGKNLKICIQLYIRGWSTPLLGQMFNKDHTTILYHMKKNNVTRSNEYERITKKHIHRYVNRIEDLNIDALVVSRFLIRHNINRTVNEDKRKEVTFDTSIKIKQKFEIMKLKKYSEYVEESKIRNSLHRKIRTCPTCKKDIAQKTMTSDPLKISCNMCHHRYMIRRYGRNYKTTNNRTDGEGPNRIPFNS